MEAQYFFGASKACNASGLHAPAALILKAIWFAVDRNPVALVLLRDLQVQLRRASAGLRTVLMNMAASPTLNRIRPFTSEDIPQVAELHRSVFVTADHSSPELLAAYN